MPRKIVTVLIYINLLVQMDPRLFTKSIIEILWTNDLGKEQI